MSSLTIFSPAKLNLFLAVTGRRADGFHDLVSVVAPLAFGDTLVIETRDPAGSLPAPRFQLACSDPAVPVDDTNLVLRAAQSFADATGWRGAAAFRLEKRVPMGAGLGGGSSNAAAALRGLNQLAGTPLDHPALARLAAGLGSDCVLFLHETPVVMRGRGERVEVLSGAAASRLSGRKVLVFKPAFGIPTPWSYRRLAELAAAAPAGGEPAYQPAEEAERRLGRWVQGSEPAEELLFNTLEKPAFEKYLAIPVLLEVLRRRFGLQPRMTGSGSACFAFLSEGAPVAEIEATIRADWGESAYLITTHVA